MLILTLIIILDIVLMLFVLRYGTRSEAHHITPDNSKAVQALRALIDDKSAPPRES